MKNEKKMNKKRCKKRKIANKITKNETKNYKRETNNKGYSFGQVHNWPWMPVWGDRGSQGLCFRSWRFRCTAQRPLQLPIIITPDCSKYENFGFPFPKCSCVTMPNPSSYGMPWDLNDKCRGGEHHSRVDNPTEPMAGTNGKERTWHFARDRFFLLQ